MGTHPIFESDCLTDKLIMSDNESSAKRPKMEEKEEEKGAENMSIEETNKLRAKLGLAPLEINNDQKAEDGSIMGNDGTAFHHVPAESITAKKKSDKLRSKIEDRRKQREIKSKLSKIKGLGEASSDEEGGVKAWVNKSRKIEKQRKKAEKKEAYFRQRDAEMAEEARILEEEQRQKAYGQNALEGLTVDHDLERFGEGKDVIMTLKDSRIMDEETGKNLDGDVLVNVDMLAKEQSEKYIENVKKSKNKQGYNPLEKYDETNLEMAAFGEKKLLSKYDETIDGEKRKKFRIGSDGKIDTTMVDIKRQMREDMVKNSVNLNLGEIKISSDFYTPDEMQGFKKRKRKVKKVRKAGMELMDDLLERRDF